MKKGITKQVEKGTKALVVLAAAFFMLSGEILADLAVSQTIVLKNAVTDEFGEVLDGNDPSAVDFGLTHVEGDLVQVLLATDGTVYPPNADGTPDERNIVLHETRIGRGTLPHMQSPGGFGTSVTPRPGGNSRIFVRVFNGRDLDEATHYGDSSIFTVSSWQNKIFVADVTAADQPLDGADNDGDGLSNSMEDSLGSDKDEADSDGDGMLDSHELIAGTDALDSEDLLQIVGLSVAGDGLLDFEVETRQGIDYRIEYYPAGEDPTPANSKLLAHVTGNGKKMIVNGSVKKIKNDVLFRVVVGM